MAEHRAIWKGNLRLALVSCPIALYGANHDQAPLHFNLINPATGNRIRMTTQDAETGEEVARRDLVRGYEYKKDSYLVLDDADFEAARIETSNNLVIDKFVDAYSIDPIYFDAGYYVAPDGDSGADVYAVLREAIARTGKVALSRLVIARRERAVALMPLGRGLVLHTLRENRDLNSASEFFAGLHKGRLDPELIRLAVQLVDRQSGDYDPADVEDHYSTRLRAIIDAKLKGNKVEPEMEDEADDGKGVDLMAALRKSLGQQPSAQLPLPKTATVARKPPPKRARQARSR